MKLTLTDRPLLECSKEAKKPLMDLVESICSLSQEARKKGLLALEDEVMSFENPFLTEAVMLIIDAVEPEQVENYLDDKIILSQRTDVELLEWLIIEDGVLMIQMGRNPRHIAQTLINTYLPEFETEINEQLAIKTSSRIPSLARISHWLGLIFEQAQAAAKIADFQELSTEEMAQLCLYLPPAYSAIIISECEREKRLAVVMQMTTDIRLDTNVLHKIKDYLNLSLPFDFESAQHSNPSNLKTLANIFNCLDRGSEKYLFDELYKTDAKLADEIRKRQFEFADIIILDDTAIQRMIRDLDSQDLVIALYDSTIEIRNRFKNNVSESMWLSIESDLHYLKNVRIRDIEEAKWRIIHVVRKLEDDGEITIPKKNNQERLV